MADCLWTYAPKRHAIRLLCIFERRQPSRVHVISAQQPRSHEACGRAEDLGKRIRVGLGSRERKLDSVGHRESQPDEESIQSVLRQVLDALACMHDQDIVHCDIKGDNVLIASDGSLLISSNQIAEKKLAELPKDFVVFATTSQFVENISTGLQGIKVQNKKNIPSNITTIKHFKVDETNNFLSYGSSSKNLYLLLLEDL
jgi:hypothetical protein